MKKLIYLILLAMFSLSSLFCRSKKEVPSNFPKSIYEIPVTDIEGKKTNLSAYKGKKILIVNVASKCGFTKQYDDLQKLYVKYGDKLVVLGFPSNEFGFQEPGKNEEIQSFCRLNYGVTFPMFSKINTKGSQISPIYQWLTDKRLNGVNDKTQSWNFAKYLIDENGKFLKFFSSSTLPMSEEITSYLK